MKLFSGPALSQFATRRPAATVSDEPPRPMPAQAPAAPAPQARPGKTAEKPAAPTAGSASVKSRAKPARAAPAIPATPEEGVRLVPIPRLAQGGRWRVEAMRSYSGPVLYWFTRGQGRITVAGVTRGYGTHNAVFLPPGTMHGFELGQQVFGTAVFFGRGSDVTLPDTPLHLRVRDTAPQAELSGILDAIQRELDSDRPGADRAARHHLGLLGVWIERQRGIATAEEKRPDAARRLVARYTRLLERDFASGKGVADYAAELGVTPTHLSRVCNQTCGRSALKLVQDRVLFEARRLLAETDLPVNRISADLGFTSPAYFTRAFQQRIGKTPTAFRKGR